MSEFPQPYVRSAWLLAALLLCTATRAVWALDCATLVNEKITGVQIVTAEYVAPGAFAAPDQSGSPPAAFRELPKFCRVVGVIRPTPDSHIGFELWLPDGWNGRYLQVGSGGFGGYINYRGMVFVLRNGFAVASTDDGHSGTGALVWGDAAWALGHPERLIDFGYRAVHLTSVVSKQVLTRYYGQNHSRAYFSGCSDGGREALMEAQRYPEDFDGYLAGAPANNFTGLMTYLLNLSQAAASLTPPLTATQLEALQKAQLARCDATDGIVDGVIDNPLQCRFKPAEIQCKGAVSEQCLTEQQVRAVSRVFEDTRGGTAHNSLTPGFQVAAGGVATQWPYWVGPVPKESGLPATESQIFSENFWPFMVYADPTLDFRKLDLLQAAAEARGRTGALINSLDPDLSAVRAAGKKIIQYHGWADGVIPAQYSIGYYEAVQHYLGTDNRDFYRLFMAPGVEHCFGGAGPTAFGMSYDPRPLDPGVEATRAFDPARHLLAALTQWVEKGVAPERIVATKYLDEDATRTVVRTRPLCVWPKVARWSGHGDANLANNFVCADR